MVSDLMVKYKCVLITEVFIILDSFILTIKYHLIFALYVILSHLGVCMWMMCLSMSCSILKASCV